MGNNDISIYMMKSPKQKFKEALRDLLNSGSKKRPLKRKINVSTNNEKDKNLCG